MCKPSCFHDDITILKKSGQLYIESRVVEDHPNMEKIIIIMYKF